MGVLTQKQSTNFFLAVALISPDGRYDSLFLSNYATLRVKDVLSRIHRSGRYPRFRQQQLRHADLDRPRKVQGTQPDHARRAGRDRRAKRTGGGRPGRAVAFAAGQSFQYNVTTLGRLSDPEEIWRDHRQDRRGRSGPACG